ncbi:MAG: hypothetical protein IJ523_12035 [Succinivibrionaceae bacterium]|nr:hypothetical protein [Succinivibrionaceae bacterium]
MKISKFLRLSFSLCAASALVCASYAEDGEKPEARDAVFAKLSKALETDNRDLFLSALRYPIKICINGKYIRATSAQTLSDYSLDQLLGSQTLKQKIRSSMAGRNAGNDYELSYGGDPVFSLDAYVSESETLRLNYTEKGVYEINRQECVMPKLNFCNNPEQDDLIYMQSFQAAWRFNSAVYENFLDHNYSKLVTIPIYDAAGGGVELTLDGKRLNLVRDPSSFDEAPIYSDGSAEYMIMLPKEDGVLYCYGLGFCDAVSYAHIFVKKKGSVSCEPGRVVLAEKMELNFCPFDQIANAEIRLFTQGFNHLSDETGKLQGKSYADDNGRASLRFEPRAMNIDTKSLAPKGTDPESSGHYRVTAAELVLDGKTLTTLSEELHAILFTDGDTEIRAVLEGDYDSPAVNTDHLVCAGDSSCNQPDSRIVLFVRNKTGICERLVLALVK